MVGRPNKSVRTACLVDQHVISRARKRQGRSKLSRESQMASLSSTYALSVTIRTISHRHTACGLFCGLATLSGALIPRRDRLDPDIPFTGTCIDPYVAHISGACEPWQSVILNAPYSA
jgi:hypothetical protein